MFKSLQPLLAERSVHILLSASKDGKISAYVAPAKKDDKEDDAFVTPFHCTATADELEAQLPGVLTQWVQTRQTVTATLAEALVAAEAEAKKAAEDAKKKAAEKGKKVTPTITSKTTTPVKTAAKVAAPVTPSLLDVCNGDDDEAGDVAENTVTEKTPLAVPVAESAPVAAVASAPETTPPAVAVVADQAAPAPAPAPATILTAAPMAAEELF